jgi:hypothetical protein
VDKNIFYTYVNKEVNLSILHHQEEEMTKLFHINIQVKKTKIDAMFDSDSLTNLIVVDLVIKLGLEVHNHLIPYPLGWVNKYANIKVTKKCKIKFHLTVDFIDELELDVLPSRCMWRASQYPIIKDGKSLIINAHKGK